jgi:hypothetical protein
MPTPVDLLVEQLWGPAMAAGAIRVGTGRPPAGWREQESYWMVPSAAGARLIVPRHPRPVTRAAAQNYRGLRRPLNNLGRLGMGTVARGGLPLGGRLGVWVPEGDEDAAGTLPLSVLAEALGRPRLYASFGVRRGANRKATLHLLDLHGRPVGFAKLGWSPTTDHFVRTEAAALRAVGGTRGTAHAPSLLAEVDYFGHPVVVTEPLPMSSRGARSSALAPPTPAELYALTPVARRAAVAATRQFQALRDRLSALPASADLATRELLAATLGLAEQVARRPEELPVVRRWHGDFAPWNRARDGDDRLWVWDWENSEEDAVAGLDALHWAFSERRPSSGASEKVDLPGCVLDARGHLVAAGVRSQWFGLVAATYALTVLERAVDLAARAEGWSTLWIKPPHLWELLAQAEALLALDTGRSAAPLHDDQPRSR